MLPASMMLPAYAWYVMVMYLACDSFYRTLFDNTGQPIFLKLMTEIKVTVAAKLYIYTALRDPKMYQQTKYGISMLQIYDLSS